MHRISHGQVKQMQLPKSWTERVIDKEEFQQWIAREFGPPGKPSVSLGLFFRGHYLSEDPTEVLEKLLSSPLPHHLNEEDLIALDELLRDASLPDAFQFYDARVEDIRGRRVLVVEGLWVRQNLQTLWLFINSDDSGLIEELYFAAPPEDYKLNLPLIVESLATIDWANQHTETN